MRFRNVLNLSLYNCAGWLITSERPVFTMYGEKVCLPAPASCGSAWSLELLPGYRLLRHSLAISGLSSHLECFARCRATKAFTCRSAGREIFHVMNWCSHNYSPYTICPLNKLSPQQVDKLSPQQFVPATSCPLTSFPRNKLSPEQVVPST